MKRMVTVLLALMLLLAATAPASAASVELRDDGTNVRFTYDDGKTSSTLGFPSELQGCAEYMQALEELLARAEAEDMPYGEFAEEFFALDRYSDVFERDRSYEMHIDGTAEAMGQPVVEAVCRFDAASGTVLEVLNDAPMIYVPTHIDGVRVTAIAENAVADKQQLETLTLPFVEVIDRVIVRDCPELYDIFIFSHYTAPEPLLLSRIAENCPKLIEDRLYREYEPLNDRVLISESGPSFIYANVNYGRSFAVCSGTFIGDGSGYDWDDGLTRAEAVTVILRLMGQDEAARAKTDEAPAFSDVLGSTAWANGYINLAYELGVTKGVGGDRFDPLAPCSARDLTTMLYRLTRLTEGRDFGWATAVTDLYADVREADEYPTDRPFTLANHAARLVSAIHTGEVFTRGMAADLIYCMMNIRADENDASLADILAAEYGLSDEAAFSHHVRRTAYGLDGGVLAHTSEDPLDPHYAYVHYYLSDEFTQRLENDDTQVTVTDEHRALAAELTDGLSTEYEKAEAICGWVATHIFYDSGKALAISSGSYVSDGSDVLETRRGVCDDYAELVRALMLASGIECYYESSASHAWNIARPDGRWVVMDMTWSSNLSYRNGEYWVTVQTQAEDYREPGVEWTRHWFDPEREDTEHPESIHGFYDAMHIIDRYPLMMGGV